MTTILNFFLSYKMSQTASHLNLMSTTNLPDCKSWHTVIYYGKDIPALGLNWPFVQSPINFYDPKRIFLGEFEKRGFHLSYANYS